MLRWRFLLFTLFLIFVLSFASFLSLSTFIFWFPSFLFRFRFIVAVSFCIVLPRTKQLFVSIFYLCYCCFQCKFAYIIGRYRRYVVANTNLSEKKNSVEKWEPSDLRFLAFPALFWPLWNVQSHSVIFLTWLGSSSLNFLFRPILLHYFWPLEGNFSFLFNRFFFSFYHG